MAWTNAARIKAAMARAARNSKVVVGRQPKILIAKTGNRRFVRGGAVLIGMGSRGAKARFGRAGLKKAPQFLARTGKSYVRYGRRVR